MKRIRCSCCKGHKGLYSTDRFPNMPICWDCTVDLQKGLARLLGIDSILEMPGTSWVFQFSDGQWLYGPNIATFVPQALKKAG